MLTALSLIGSPSSLGYRHRINKKLRFVTGFRANGDSSSSTCRDYENTGRFPVVILASEIDSPIVPRIRSRGVERFAAASSALTSAIVDACIRSFGRPERSGAATRSSTAASCHLARYRDNTRDSSFRDALDAEDFLEFISRVSRYDGGLTRSSGGCWDAGTRGRITSGHAIGRTDIGPSRARRAREGARRDRRGGPSRRGHGDAAAPSRRARCGSGASACRALPGELSHGSGFPDHRRGGAAD